ncbi:MAG TPA: response regulator [Flavobacterium sp.]|jgi:CheY-like chemotaxis protein
MEYHKKFLFIDDDADDRDFFCDAMQMVDPSSTCHFANDGMDGIDKLVNDLDFTPDYIFIDMNMPRMDGIECLREIRKIERLSRTLIYMYSTSINPKLNEELRQSGAADILVKPSTIKDLNALLQQVLSQNP